MTLVELRAEPVLDVGATHGEGPFWDGLTQRLGWVDLMRGHLHLFDPSTHTDEIIEVGRPLGAAAPRAPGGYVLAIEDGFALLDSGEAQPRPIATVDTDDGRLRMNDGKCDPAGRIFAGTMAYDLTPQAGALYRLDPGGDVTRVLSDVGISNGLDWSSDGSTMYFIDSFAFGVDAFDWSTPSATMSNRRRFVDIRDDGTAPAGFVAPDGMTLDIEDHLWVTVFGAGQVRRYSPAGVLEQVVHVPTACPTSCAFGGPDLDTLYITSSADGGAGGGILYACAVGVRGRAAHTYGA